jgi:O-antigen/teichoic acid export membrane protein
MIQGTLKQWSGPGLRGYLIRGAAGSLVLRVTGAGLTLGGSVFLARVLGPQGYGVYAYVLSIAMLLAIPAALGLPNLLIRLVATYEARGDWGLLRGLLQRANQVVLPASGGLALAAALIGWILADHLPSGSLFTFWIAMATLPLLSLGQLRTAALRGLRHVLAGQTPETLVKPGLFLLLAAGVYLALGAGRFDPAWAMAMQLAAIAASFSVGATLLLRRVPKDVWHADAGYSGRAWAVSAAPLLVVGGMQVINSYTDILMLGSMKGAAAAGVYRAVWELASLISFSLIAANMALAPAIARLWATGDRAQLQRMVTAAARGTLALSLPLGLLFILGGRLVLEVVFGAAFASGATALAILSGAQLANVAVGSVGYILMMTGHERDAALGVGVAAVVNVALNGLFIPFWGISGAAAATGISLVTWNLLLVWRVSRSIGIHTTAFSSLGLRERR